MSDLSCDICIIGAGSGGLSVAAGSAQLGARVVLIEGHKMGGDCLNYGCVPSKSLIASAKAAYGLAHPGELGVAPAEPQIDYAAAKDHVARVIEAIAPVDSQERFEGLGVQVIRDWARFADERTVIAGHYRIAARRFVIATGSSPLVPPIEGLGDVPHFTNETIFDLRERPRHLLIIGGGPIGLEMAQAHRRLGSDVTVIEAERALAKDEPEAAEIVLARLGAEGVTIVQNAPARRVARMGDDIRIETDAGSHTGSHLLVAVGREVNLDRLDLERANVARDCAVIVGKDLRSVTNRRVYAVGDAAGGMQFTHVAGYHAGLVVRSALFGLPAKVRRSHIPRCTYTDPELAHVGLTEPEARKLHGDGVETVTSAFSENDRAQATGKTTGFIKVSVVKGRPVGATIVGAQAGDLIAMWSMAIANRLKMKTLSDTVLPYPTLSEINKRAAGAYFSPRLFQSDMVKGAVRLVQRYLP